METPKKSYEMSDVDRLALTKLFLENYKIKNAENSVMIPEEATICNSIYIGQELLNLPLNYKFHTFGRNGVISLDVCIDYEEVLNHKVHDHRNEKEIQQTIKVAKYLSNFTDEELADVAQLLWNDGAYFDENKKRKANEIRTNLITL